MAGHRLRKAKKAKKKTDNKSQSNKISKNNKVMGNKNSNHQKQQDTTTQRRLEEGSAKEIPAQGGAVVQNNQCRDKNFKILNIQEVDSYPVKDMVKPAKITATLILLLLLLFVIILLPSPFWLLLVPPVLILLYTRWYKPMSKPHGPGPSGSTNGSNSDQPKPDSSEPCKKPISREDSYADLSMHKDNLEACTKPISIEDSYSDLSTHKDNLEPYKKPIDHPLGPPLIPPKLQNFGNTCFFNAALQGIISTSEFYTLDVMTVYRVPTYRGSTLRVGTYTKQYVVPSKTCDVPLEIEVTSKPGPLTVSLNLLLWSVHESSFPTPRNLLTQLGKRNPRFIRRTQEDSHEALRCIFGAIKDEEIQLVKRKIEESKKNLDGEEKLNMKGYLRMATKLLTAIGEAIEGKTISVTICHDCHEVTEIEEPFFDISLPIPEENTFEKKATGNFSHTKLNQSRVEMKESSIKERKKTKEKNNKIFPESGSKLEPPTSATLPDESIKHKKENITNTEGTDSMPSNKTGIDTDAIRLNENGNDLTEQIKTQKVTDIDTMISIEDEDGNNVKEQQSGDMQGTQTDLHTDTLATKLEDRSVSHDTTAELEARNHLLKMAINKSKSRKDSDLGNSPTVTNPNSASHGMPSAGGFNSADLVTPHTNLHGANVIAETANQQHSDKITVEKNFTVVLKEPANDPKDNADLNAQQSVEENDRSPSAQHSSFQRTKEVKQGVFHKDAHEEGLDKCHSSRSVTKDKDAFQQFLIQKGLNHLTEANRKHAANYDLQLSLFIHTDLDVLDEENKFICHSCSTRKQQNFNDDPILCLVSKQIMIHQLPPVLILHMKRFEFNINGPVTKDNRHVPFPKILNMAPYCTVKCLKDLGDSEDKILYGLYAVVVHSGRTLHGGHYTAYVKTQRPTEEKKAAGNFKNGRIKQKYDTGYCEKGQWYYTSDTTVMKCSFGDVKRSEAYMLFYERLPLTNCN